MSYVVIDTETNGVMDYKRPADAEGQPRVAEFAAILLDDHGNVEAEFQRYIRPDGWGMSPETTEINGLTDALLNTEGVPIAMVLDAYASLIVAGRAVVAFGAQFDCKMMRSEFRRAGRDDLFERTPNICLMRSARPFAKQIGREIIKAGGNNKGWPKLSDLCAFLEVAQAKGHSALDDARATAECFRIMLSLGFDPRPEVHHAKDYEAIKTAV
jgi:DNA polymerase III epsilon subunit-like protein